MIPVGMVLHVLILALGDIHVHVYQVIMVRTAKLMKMNVPVILVKMTLLVK